MGNRVSEKAIETALTRGITAIGGICWKWPASARAGVPDRIVIVQGQVWFVELKRPGGELRPVQVAAHNQLMGAGANVVVLSSRQGVEEFLKCLK